MLKYKIDSLDGIEKALQSFYEERDGAFILKVDGLDDGAELKRAKDHEKRARQQAEKQLQELTAQLQAKEEELEKALINVVPKASAEQLESSYKNRIAKLEKEREEEKNKYRGQIEKMLVDQKAEAIARSLVVEGSEQVLIPHLKQRIAFNENDFSTVFKNGDGIDYSEKELVDEFRNNPAFAPLLVASKATGGGASQSKNGGAVAKTISRSQFDAMDAGAKRAHLTGGGTITD